MDPNVLHFEAECLCVLEKNPVNWKRLCGFKPADHVCVCVCVCVFLSFVSGGLNLEERETSVGTEELI